MRIEDEDRILMIEEKKVRIEYIMNPPMPRRETGKKKILK